MKRWKLRKPFVIISDFSIITRTGKCKFSIPVLFQHYSRREGSQLMLFDIESDPREEHNIAGDHPDIVADLLGDVEELKKGRPRHPRYWMMSPNWTQGFVAGKFTGRPICFGKDIC